MEKILFEKGSFKFKLIVDETPPGLIKLINKTWLGSKGLRYRHGRVEHRLTGMKDPYHLSLMRGDKVLGNVTYGRYVADMDFGTANAYYIRYFAFQSNFKTNIKDKDSSKGNNTLKSLTGRVMFKHPAEQGIGYGENLSDPAFHFAYIEPDNMRSLHHAFGFKLQPSRNFETLPFTRTNPSKKVDFKRIKEGEKEEVRNLLKDYYSDHNGVIFHYLFHKDNFFTVRNESGEIIAACQANDCLFHITDTGSKVFNGIVQALKVTGLDKKLLDVGNLGFLSFDHIYYKEGCESVLIDLFESLLHEFNLKLALMFFDTESPVLKMLKSSGKLGWISRFYSTSPNVVVTHNLNLTEEQNKSLREKPWFIASYDVT